MRRWTFPVIEVAVLLAASLLTTACTPPVGTVVTGTPATTQSVASTPGEPAEVTSATDTTMTFAVIGDYGDGSTHERAVANMVASWHPSFIIATGDDYYSPAGGTGTGRYDRSTGAFYGAWLKDIHTTGHILPVGPAAVNAFFPALGNHDYSDAKPSPSTYLTYFRLPGAGFTNSSRHERFYDFVEGPVHFFVLNSNSVEASGTSATSQQAKWLKTQLAASTSPWNVVYDHHPPYSSDSTHGSTKTLRWPFATWGADVVISGHAHVYERVLRNGIVYFVNGLGGAKRYAFTTPVAGSAVRYRANWGAQRVLATTSTLDFEFVSVGGNHVDRYRLTAPLGE